MTQAQMLSIILGVVFIADVFFSAAVIRNLRKYTLPDWTASRIIIPVYVALSGLCFGYALFSLIRLY